MPSITKRTVDATSAGVTVWDDRIPRFGLRVSKGGTKSYVLKYRINGRQRWHTIGQHGKPVPIRADDGPAEARGQVWTADRARAEALRLLGLVEAGRDPAREKTDRRKAETVADFALRFMDGHVRAHNKARTVEEVRRNLEKYVLPALGGITLRDLTREDVKDFHVKMKATPYAANRCLALVSKMLSTAEEWGALPNGSAICRRMTKFKEKARERYLSGDELLALGGALKEAEADGLNPHGLAIIRLLVLTGARRREIETLRWDEVKLDRGILNLSDSKTGEKVINLPPAALAVLSSYPREYGTPYVFPASSVRKPRPDPETGEPTPAPYQGLMKVWRNVRKRAGLEDVRIHDLRHTYASFAVAGGMSLPLIGALLGHKRSATTERYAHLAAAPVRQAADRVGDAVAAALVGAATGRPSGSGV